MTATADESVVDAAHRMSAFNVGDLIVVENQAEGLPRPIGLITDRDLVVKVLARPDRLPAQTLIGDVMSQHLVLAGESEDIERVLTKMREHAIRRMPVVDADGGLQGILTIDDVVGWMRDQIQQATRLLERQSETPLSRL